MNSRDAQDARYPLTCSTVRVAGRALELTHPRSVDDLINEEDFDIDERIPYWGAIWPSARVMAERIAVEPGGGRRLLELGCGLGLVSLAASLAGFEVLASDYYQEALDFTQRNAQRNGVSKISTRLIDWRHFPDELRDFDFVLASDVLYDRGNASWVARAFAHALAPGGQGMLTDPGRSIARTFSDECRRQNLTAECVALEQIVDGAMNCVVELFEVRHAA